jgi:tetratricopeptide (TPR) repeat protein
MTMAPRPAEQRWPAIGGVAAALRALTGAVLLSALCAGCSGDPAADLAAAAAQAEAGDFRSAMLRVNQVLQVEPDRGDARLLRGRIALAGGDPLLARDEFRKAQALGAEEPQIELLLADASAQLGEAEQALEILDAAPEMQRDAAYWTVRSEVLLVLRRLPEAAAAADTAAAGGETSRLLLIRGRIANLSNEPARAEQSLTEALALAKTRRERAQASAARGVVRLRAREFDAAVGDLEAAASAFAEDPVSAREVAVWAALVRANLTRNEFDAAAAAASRMNERAPGISMTSLTAALVAYRRGRIDEAVTRLQRAANRAPREPLFATLLGVAHLAEGDLYQAEQQFLHALAIDPDNLPTLKLLVEARLLQQRPDAALHAIEEFPHPNDDVDLRTLEEVARVRAGPDPGGEADQLLSGLTAGGIEAAWQRIDDLLSAMPEESAAYAAAAVYELHGR